MTIDFYRDLVLFPFFLVLLVLGVALYVLWCAVLAVSAFLAWVADDTWPS